MTWNRLRLLLGTSLLGLTVAANAQSWSGFAGNPQHTGLSQVSALPLSRVLWQLPLVVTPNLQAQSEWVPSPVVTSQGVVVLTVETATSIGAFHLEGRNVSTGALLWSEPTDFKPIARIYPSNCSPSLYGDAGVVYPGAGGTIYERLDASAQFSSRVQDAFYGMDQYLAHKQAMDQAITIVTPLLTAPNGNVYFGFTATSNPIGLQSGIACVKPGSGRTWISASAASGDSSITTAIPLNTFALSPDGSAIYTPVRSGDRSIGYLLKLDADTLQPLARARLRDPSGGVLEMVGTSASVMAGPDGNVYYGAYAGSSNSYRGFLLQFTKDLLPSGAPGPFGWDCTASVVPSSAVPSYTGTSSYLVLTKYNNYLQNLYRLGIFDPNSSVFDSIAGTNVMRDVLVSPRSQQEWCVNSVAVDPFSRCAIANNENGSCYQWDFTTNTFTNSVSMTRELPEAYTPTVIAPNGVCFAIKANIVFALGQ